MFFSLIHLFTVYEVRKLTHLKYLYSNSYSLFSGKEMERKLTNHIYVIKFCINGQLNNILLGFAYYRIDFFPIYN